MTTTRAGASSGTRIARRDHEAQELGLHDYRHVPTLRRVCSIRMTNGVLAAPRLRRRRLADYAKYANQDLVEEIANLGRRLTGLRVLHLSSSDPTTDPVPADLPSVVALEREVGVESAWLVPRSDAELHGAARASRWWPHPTEADWSSWISSNFRAARDIKGTWDVAVVHGPSLAGVAGIAEDKAAVWLWQPPCWAPEPGGLRAEDYLARYSGVVGRDNRVGATVDPLAPFNARFPRDVARRVGPLLDVDTDRPFLCHISRFAPWAELDEVIAAYWEAKSIVTELQLVVGGAAGSRRDSRRCNGVVARASEDPDLRALPDLSSMEIAALRSCATINIRGPAASGYAVDVRESHWMGRLVLAWPQRAHASDPPLDGHTQSAAQSVRATGLQFAELLMSADAPPLDTRGHEAVESKHLIVHGLRDWLRTLDRWSHGARKPLRDP